MPSALATILAALQLALGDATEAVWTEAELEAHILEALKDLSHWLPLELKDDIATTPDSRDVDISTLVPRIKIVTVEFPVDNFPKTFTRFSMWGDTLTMLDAIGDGTDCNVYWHAFHDISEGTETLPEDHDELLVFAAAAHACDAKATSTTDTLPTGGPGTEGDWSALARHFRSRYEERRNPRSGVRVTRMYTPVEPTATQDSDPGP